MVAGAWGGWSCHICSQTVESGEFCVQLALSFLCNTEWTSAHSRCHPPTFNRGRGSSCNLNLETPSQLCPEVCFQGDPKSYKMDSGVQLPQ